MSSELKYFLLSMCTDAPESTTSSRSGLSEVDASGTLVSIGERNVAFFSFLELVNMFRQIPCCIFLRARFPHVIFPMDPILTEFL